MLRVWTLRTLDALSLDAVFLDAAYFGCSVLGSLDVPSLDASYIGRFVLGCCELSLCRRFWTHFGCCEPWTFRPWMLCVLDAVSLDALIGPHRKVGIFDTKISVFHLSPKDSTYF